MVDRGYTKDSDQVKLGPIELMVKNKEMVNIPVWAGVATIVVGVAYYSSASSAPEGVSVIPQSAAARGWWLCTITHRQGPALASKLLPWSLRKVGLGIGAADVASDEASMPQAHSDGVGAMATKPSSI